MPREDRRIIFEYEEVYKALYALCHQKQLPKPPPGAIQSVVEDEKDNNQIRITLINPQSSNNQQIIAEYNRDFLAAALMVMCRGQGIPLPKSARKSVVIGEGDVVLRVQVG